MHAFAQALTKDTKEYIGLIADTPAARSQFRKATNLVEVDAVQMPSQNSKPVVEAEPLDVR